MVIVNYAHLPTYFFIRLVYLFHQHPMNHSNAAVATVLSRSSWWSCTSEYTKVQYHHSTKTGYAGRHGAWWTAQPVVWKMGKSRLLTTVVWRATFPIKTNNFMMLHIFLHKVSQCVKLNLFYCNDIEFHRIIDYYYYYYSLLQRNDMVARQHMFLGHSWKRTQLSFFETDLTLFWEGDL